MFNLLTIIVDAIHCRGRGDGLAETGGTGTRDAAKRDCKTGISCDLSHALACRSIEEDNPNK
jgi:hypothetical protein